MSFYVVDPAKSCVLFFDMLNRGYGNISEAERPRKEPMVKACVRIREAADSHGIPVFFARADHRPDGMDGAIIYTDLNRDRQPWTDPDRPYASEPPYIQDPQNVAGHWGSQVIDELSLGPADYVIAKHRYNAFHETHLGLSLRTRGIDTIVLCGGATPAGIASTVYGARDMDYNVIVVRDAVTGGEEFVHDMFMAHVFPRLGRVRSSDEVVQMMAAGATASS